MTDGDYRRAADLFKQVVDKYPQVRQGRRRALLARLVAQPARRSTRSNKADLDDALAAIDRLRTDYAEGARRRPTRVTLRAQIRSTQASLGDPKAAGDVADRGKGTEPSSAPAPARRPTRRCAWPRSTACMNMNSADAIPILQGRAEADATRAASSCARRRCCCSRRSAGPTSPRRCSTSPATIRAPTFAARRSSGCRRRGPKLAIPALDSDSLHGQGRGDSQEGDLRALAAVEGRARPRVAPSARPRTRSMPEEIRERGDLLARPVANLADLDFFRTLFRKTQERRSCARRSSSRSSRRSRPEATAWLLDIAKDKSFDVDIRKDAIF